MLIMVSGLVVTVLGIGFLLQNNMGFMPFVVTFNVGLILIIIVCVSEVILLERARNTRKVSTTPINFDVCPDNFTKRVFNNVEICSNELLVKDPSNPNTTVLLKTYPVDDPSLKLGAGQRPFPSRHSQVFMGNEQKHEKFRLNEIQQHGKLTTNEQKCSVLYSEPTSADLTDVAGYSLIPWTTMKSRCSSTFTS